MQAKRMRPKPYTEVIHGLENFKCYSASSIAYFGLKSKLLRRPSPCVRDRTLIIRTRASLARFAAKHLPQAGDGLIKLYGHGTSPGWFGWRWKLTYLGIQPPPDSEHAALSPLLVESASGERDGNEIAADSNEGELVPLSKARRGDAIS